MISTYLKIVLYIKIFHFDLNRGMHGQMYTLIAMFLWIKASANA